MPCMERFTLWRVQLKLEKFSFAGDLDAWWLGRLVLGIRF